MSKYIQHGNLKIWPMEGGGFALSDEGGWLPGLYDTEDTAKKAHQLLSGKYVEWSELSDRICYHSKENRFITMSDLTLLGGEI